MTEQMKYVKIRINFTIKINTSFEESLHQCKYFLDSSLVYNSLDRLSIKLVSCYSIANLFLKFIFHNRSSFFADRRFHSALNRRPMQSAEILDHRQQTSYGDSTPI